MIDADPLFIPITVYAAFAALAANALVFARVLGVLEIDDRIGVLPDWLIILIAALVWPVTIAMFLGDDN